MRGEDSKKCEPRGHGRAPRARAPHPRQSRAHPYHSNPTTSATQRVHANKEQEGGSEDQAAPTQTGTRHAPEKATGCSSRSAETTVNGKLAAEDKGQPDSNPSDAPPGAQGRDNKGGGARSDTRSPHPTCSQRRGNTGPALHLPRQ